MSTCKLDHSLEDVRKKFETQTPFLPSNSIVRFSSFFESQPSQLLLNEVFHLLKKYDLIEPEERKARNVELERILAGF